MRSGSRLAPYDATVESEPRHYPMIWAVRAVPVLMIFGALDLIKPNPPLLFLVLTLVRLAAGVAVLLMIRTRRRDRLGLAYAGLVSVTCLVTPQRAAELLILSVLALVAIGVDQLWQRSRWAKPPEEVPIELREIP